MIPHSEVDYMKEIEDKSVEVGVVQEPWKEKSSLDPLLPFLLLAPEASCCI